jgi:dihydrodipicolinate synthase/N-acetylneuraminate lyase
MDIERAKQRLQGCYVTIPTMFRDDDLELNLPAIRRHVRFLMEGGIQEGTGVVLTGGGAGDFSTMTVAERLQVAEAVIDETAGRIPVTVGAQTTSTRELREIASAAQELRADYLQVSPPFYFAHTEDDFFEYLAAASEAAPEVGLIVYNTYWTSTGLSYGMVQRMLELPNVVGLKWSSPDAAFFGFERVVQQFADRVSIIDNQLRFVTSHMLGARMIEVHIANHWPQWAVGLWRMLEEKRYEEVQHEMMHVVMPFYLLWQEMEQFTSGDGYLDKLCMELVGLDASRCRPPTRDVRERFREQARQMLIECGTPNVVKR